MKVKFLSVIAIAVAVMSVFTGCGENEKSDKSKSESQYQGYEEYEEAFRNFYNAYKEKDAEKLLKCSVTSKMYDATE